MIFEIWNLIVRENVGVRDKEGEFFGAQSGGRCVEVSALSVSRMASMSDLLPSDWLDVLWPAVCARVRRPVAGVCLDGSATAEVASGLFGMFLAEHDDPPGSLEASQAWLAERASASAVAWVARARLRAGNPDLHRDAEAAFWERNPDFDALRVRDVDGVLTSPHWGMAGSVLRRRALPVLARLGVRDEDAEDVVMEALGELTQARLDGAGPLEKMAVFEELPRFFATMAERRGISWLRKQSARKRQPSNPALADPLDAPDSLVRRTLTDPRSTRPDSPQSPWENASFDAIFAACRAALTDFEWHLLTTLFVEGTHTRLDLANDPWVLGQIGIAGSASESKRRRRLNLFIEEALSRLGRALDKADL